MYRGPMPSNKDADWFRLARRVGKYEWNRVKQIVFHPLGDLYATTHDGELYKGQPPENENETWMYAKATKIGTKIWNQFDAIAFDPKGIMYAVSNRDKIYKGPPPTDEDSQWLSSSLLVGEGGWSRLTHFMAFAPDGKLWCIDRYNGNIYRGDPPTPSDTNYRLKAEYLGWYYNELRFFAFTKDKTIHNILSFEFLPDQGQRTSESPQVIGEKIYDNRESTTVLKHVFMIQKTIKEISSFTHSHGFTFEAGTETTVKTGIPLIAEGEVKISVNMSTTHNWDLTESNETEVTFSSNTEVELEPGKAIRITASVLKATLRVPYKAKVRTLFGSEVEVSGTWEGVSYYHLVVKQKDYDK
ncbi:hypothetical protein GDO81_029593 [Engystomops pustulosus]|uniref:Tachylectin 2 domain-containing protein n=1 Tax=Engystomops pustulosus TaxID=76066 RepID=A0AAV6ZCJ5_ENGPU|nr:hypothetical protein GDO81_029593 [Engystomops pustulosus]KAG8546907.1 hypothetical protein GDO81_029593 [Engystomops pustulosus]